MEERSNTGIDRQTLVMFLNDNGGPWVVGANGPYRGFKSHYHEGGIRVPAAARSPGQIPAGGSTDEMLHAVDLFPTLCRLAGAGIGKGLPLDGRDAWPTMASRAPPRRNCRARSPGRLRRPSAPAMHHIEK